MNVPATVSGGPIDVDGILQYARHAGFSARCVRATWSEPRRISPPGHCSAPTRRLCDSRRGRGRQAVVLHTEQSRPTVIGRTEFNEMWTTASSLSAPLTRRRPRRSHPALNGSLAALGHNRQQFMAWLRTLRSPAAAREPGEPTGMNRGRPRAVRTCAESRRRHQPPRAA